MKLLANENVPLAAVDALAADGHDVFCLSRESPGITDEKALALACAQNRVIITFDRDYGELIFRRGLVCPPAVLYLRFAPSHPLEPAQVVFDLFRQKIEIIGHFLVIERDSVRRRPLPANNPEEKPL